MPVKESDVESDAWPSDDSEDDDYEVSDVEDALDMDLDIEDDYIVGEKDLADNIPEKTFEDYSDGSHVLDKMYINVDYADNKRYTAKCLISDCNWRIHAAVLRDNSSKYKACFISFAARVKGFLGGCRPIIGIDGAHLSGYYKGIMLTTVSIDGNNKIFVLAYGIVDTESIDSWTYFFRNLRCLCAQYGSEKDDWTFMSDRMRVLNQLCLRCSQEQLGEYAASISNAYNEYVYGKAMSKIKEYDAATFDYLTEVEEQWSMHKFDRTICCDHNTTNFVESFNAITKSNRDMHVLTLLEGIGSRFDKAIDMESNELTDYAKGVLETRSDESRFCHVTAANGGEFEVGDGHVKFLVTLGNITCGCRKWQGSGIPCKHGLRVI
ncbi:uncharacterized protein LOC110728635 [Chenopodium quinoa]|uniref:uncharacterized protein LOC110728635 n=1 Tax=Chenopodium quinoa TaxID=63459 RepID=UPI000B77C91C|nr:uncharacterized protein LOC110728635 [Chenopodium quinoa]